MSIVKFFFSKLLISLVKFGPYIIMSALVLIWVKLPLMGITKICNISFMFPVIAGICSCLVFIMFKSYEGKNFQYKQLLFVFLWPFILFSFVSAFNSYIGVHFILDLFLLPFSIEIVAMITPEGLIVPTLVMQSVNPNNAGTGMTVAQMCNPLVEELSDGALRRLQQGLADEKTEYMLRNPGHIGAVKFRHLGYSFRLLGGHGQHMPELYCLKKTDPHFATLCRDTNVEKVVQYLVV